MARMTTARTPYYESMVNKSQQLWLTNFAAAAGRGAGEV